MTTSNILKYILRNSILFLLILFSVNAGAQNFGNINNNQNENFDQTNNNDNSNQLEYVSDFSRIDTNKYKFGLRFGVDLTGPVGTLFNSDRILYKGSVDARVYKKYFVAAEYGYELFKYKSPNLNYDTEGFFTTVGGDIDLLGFPYPMNDIYYVGIRYGISRYKTTVNEYRIENSYWGNDPFIGQIDSQTGYAHWLNLRMGLKVEIFNNFYLGASAGFNFLFRASRLENFDNLYIPGFGSLNNKKAFVFNYTLMYLLPFN